MSVPLAALPLPGGVFLFTELDEGSSWWEKVQPAHGGLWSSPVRAAGASEWLREEICLFLREGSQSQETRCFLWHDRAGSFSRREGLAPIKLF